MKTKITELWNQAVSEVGGTENTESNFWRIADRFRLLGAFDDLTMEEMTQEIKDNYEATSRFMVVRA